jgi:predicted sulfurtransferase
MAARAAAVGGALTVGVGCCAAVASQHWHRGGASGARQQHSPPPSSPGSPPPQRVLLFYTYVAIEDVDGTVSWVQSLAARLGLLGRVLLADEGVNGSVAGTAPAVAEFTAAMSAHPLFGGIDWKSSGVEEGELAVESGRVFGDLLVRRVKELVSTAGAVSLADVAQHGGEHLSPAEFHARVLEAQRSDDVVLLDVRNTFESDIGRFDGATPVPMASFSEYTSFAESKLPELRGKQVLMYCTGGIRCEKASAYLRKRGVQDVSQLSGGIHRYLEAFPEGSGGAYRGKNFVFDRRMSQSAPGGHVVGRCVGCEAAHDAYEARMVRHITPCGLRLCVGMWCLREPSRCRLLLLLLLLLPLVRCAVSAGSLCCSARRATAQTRPSSTTAEPTAR